MAAIIGLEGLTAPQKTVLVVMAVQAGSAGQCTTPVLEIARLSSLSERTVQRALRDLEQGGCLRSIEKPGHPTTFRIIFSRMLPEGCQSGTPHSKRQQKDQRKPVPAGFAEAFIRHGWRGVETIFGSRTGCNKRWIQETGGDELLEKRRVYRKNLRRIQAGDACPA